MYVVIVVYSHSFRFLPCLSPDIHAMSTYKDCTGVWILFHGYSHAFLDRNKKEKEARL